MRGRAETKKEGCKVYVTKTAVLKKPLVGLVRVKNPVVMSAKDGIRYFLFVLGSVDCTSTQQ